MLCVRLKCVRQNFYFLFWFRIRNLCHLYKWWIKMRTTVTLQRNVIQIENILTKNRLFSLVYFLYNKLINVMKSFCKICGTSMAAKCPPFS